MLRLRAPGGRPPAWRSETTLVRRHPRLFLWMLPHPGWPGFLALSIGASGRGSVGLPFFDSVRLAQRFGTTPLRLPATCVTTVRRDPSRVGRRGRTLPGRADAG